MMGEGKSFNRRIPLPACLPDPEDIQKGKENKGRVAYHVQTVHVISLRFAIVLRRWWKYLVEETSGGNFRELGVS